MKKKHLFIFLITFFIVLGVYFYAKNISSPDNLPEENRQQEESQKSQLNRQEIMKDVAGRISNISPVEPVLGGNWYVIRFWFIKDNDENFYAEYEDGHILRQILASAEKKDDRMNYKVIGYFEPGETTWTLKKGENPFFDKSLDLYEYDEESDRWIKKN